MNPTNEITIPVSDEIILRGNLEIPPGATSFVIFSHGSGSSRYSVRNRYVAHLLNEQKMATLLTDLLTEEEDRQYENRFNIELITERLVKITLLVRQRPGLQNLKVGYFGASTGGASALRAAARLGKDIHAVVSRGGRPDLAGDALPKVMAPTLLIVGSYDIDVIRLNQQAFKYLQCEKKLEIVKGASHLFEEPGKLDEVAALAQGWFGKYLHVNPILSSH